MRIQLDTPPETVPGTWFSLPIQHHQETSFVEIHLAQGSDTFQNVPQLLLFYPTDCILFPATNSHYWLLIKVKL